MFCPAGQYNVVAAIWFQTPEAIVRSLFHDEPGILLFDLTFSIISFMESIAVNAGAYFI